MRRLGIDIGGTFTDLVLFESATGELRRHKVLTTPADPAEGVIQGVGELLEASGAPGAALGEVVYATTVATNSLLERKGPATALLTTEGFRDVLLLQRQARYDLYDLMVDKAAPVLTRRQIYGVEERMDAAGSVLVPLEEDDVRRLVDVLATEGVVTIAITFLHAYANDAHERRAADIIEAIAPTMHVSRSAVVAPVVGEYERTVTTVVDAYVKPLTIEHLGRLTRQLTDLGVQAPLRVMLSDGGVTSVDEASRRPVRMIESGPAAGAQAGAAIGVAVGESNVIAFDMGGTTAKVALIEDGRPALGDSLEVDREGLVPGSGLPLSIPSVDLIEIGSGGGSVAVMQGGILTVGPESAGADPGPACYARSGTRATVTDADLLLGYLSPDYFLGGRLSLDVEAAEAAVRRDVGAPLGLSLQDAARGIYEVINSNMEAAIRAGTVRRGRDPRDYALVATGGAGPMHAVALAKALGITRVMCPSASGVASALGLLMAEHRTHLVRATVNALDETAPRRIAEEFEHLRREAEEIFADEVHAGSELTFRHAVGVRYRGQGYDLKVELPGDGALDPTAVAERFYAAYEQLYGRTATAPLEITTAHIDAVLDVPRIQQLARPHAAELSGMSGPRARRRVFDVTLGAWLEAAVWRQDAVPAGTSIAGPAVLEQDESTAVFFTGDEGWIDEGGNLIVSVAAPGRRHRGPAHDETRPPTGDRLGSSRR